ncbi:hypothetical protein DAPPUDRAFT_311165 [Daphnia pulex]|uniref:Uncharacterized protein n=1 Tax=Daphnia pulex TaxID=6669 RepID=E9FUV6_DAPPU|nr:hypothetical protein DAPPUDRAFT_311165 [Daphnia pulex]|eukprot:EFX88854.1 hypothetical protein DAPPUDRAFT_311165 [Daphnia pulex]
MKSFIFLILLIGLAMSLPLTSHRTKFDLTKLPPSAGLDNNSRSTGSKTTPTKVPAKPEKPPKKKEEYFFIPPCVYCG